MGRREQRELVLVIEGKNNSERAIDSFADGVDKSTKKVKSFSTGLKALDGQLAVTEKNISELRKEIHRTGDVELFKDLDKQIRRQQSLLKKRKLLGPDDGADAASGFFMGFSGRLGPLVGRMPLGGPLGAALAGAGAAAAPLLVSTISGAVVAGVATAPIAGAVALLADDPAVQSAGAALGKEVLGDMRQAASSFRAPILTSLGIIRRAAKELKPEFQGIFDISSTRLVPLTQAGVKGVREIVDAFSDANEKAQPVVDVLEVHIPRAAKVAGDLIRAFASDTENSAEALNVSLTLVESSIAGVAKAIELANKAYPFLRSGPLATLADHLDKSGEEAEDSTENIEDYAGAIQAARQASDKLIASLNELNGIQLDANQAERAFQQAIDDAKDAFDGKVKRLDLGTEKGREYSAALDAIAESAETSAQAIYDNTQSQELANRKIKEGRDALYLQARAFGLSHERAMAYVNSVLAIPKSWNTKVTADVAAAKAALRDTKDILLSLRSRKLTVTVVQNLIKDNDYTGIARGYERGGEITELPGPRGKDSGFIRAARGEFVLDTDTVDAAGGPSAIERWRRMLKSGPSYAAPRVNPYKASSSAAAPSAGGVLPVGVVGGNANSGFAALFHELLRSNAVQLVVRDGPLRGTRIGVG